MSAPTWAAEPLAENWKSFTSIFGTALHGSEITWYNNPVSEEAGEATELKMKWVQNMHALHYTWYDETNADDTWFVGNKNLNGAVPFDPAAVDAAAIDGTDITHMIQFTNPVTTDTPTLDAYYVVSHYTVPDPGSGNNYVPSLAWASETAKELIPQSDYDIATEDSSNSECATPADVWTLVDSGN